MRHQHGCRSGAGRAAAALMFGLFAVAGSAAAQSTASSYSYGTYNPVQAAINRDSMNAAILKQAAGGKKTAKKTVKARAHTHHRAG